jgi:hypothetical protein
MLRTIYKTLTSWSDDIQVPIALLFIYKVYKNDSWKYASNVQHKYAPNNEWSSSAFHKKLTQNPLA